MAFRQTARRYMAAAHNASLPWQELRLSCPDGTILAGQRWKATPNPESEDNSAPRRTVVCLHGWMDNCRSFHLLAPKLVAANYDVIALDHPCHGRSAHKPEDAPPMVAAELAFYLSEAIHTLKEMDEDINKQEKLTLIGHSMGAATSALYTSAFPERVRQLVLLDGGYFLPRNPMEASKHVRDYIGRRRRSLVQPKPRKVYDRLEDAIQARIESAFNLEGPKSISYEAAKEIVQRSTHTDMLSLEGADEEIDYTLGEAGVQFRHDARVAWPQIQYMHLEQTEGILKSLRGSDVCFLLAEEGFPFHHLEQLKEWIPARVKKTLPGGHHFHADPDASDLVAETVLDFLASDPTS